MRKNSQWGREVRMMELAELVGVYDPHEVERERLAARIDRADRARALLLGGFFGTLLFIGFLAYWGTT